MIIAWIVAIWGVIKIIKALKEPESISFIPGYTVCNSFLILLTSQSDFLIISWMLIFISCLIDYIRWNHRERNRVSSTYTPPPIQRSVYNPPSVSREQHSRPTAISKPSPTGGAYLIKSGRFYKIGKAEVFDKRIKQIKLLMPEAVEVIHKIHTHDAAGEERKWHKKFAAQRRNGEWFELSEADVTEFKRGL